MCSYPPLFKLIFSCLIYGVHSHLILQNYHLVNNMNLPPLNSNKQIFERYNFSGPHINVSEQNKSELFSSLSSNEFHFWEVCRKTFFGSDNTYYGDRHVSLILLDIEFLEPIEVYSELGPVTLYTANDNLKLSRNVILVVSSSSQFHKLLYSKDLWHQKSVYVIVLLECSLDVKMEMEALWQFHSIFKYVLVCGEQKPLLYMYGPYIPDTGRKIFEITDVTKIESKIVHAVDNLYGLQLRVVLFPLIPTALTDRDGKYIGGVDYFSLQVLQQRMNFSSVIYPPTDGQTFPQPGNKLSGSTKDLSTGKADIAFNGHFLQNYGIDEVEMTSYVYMDKLCFVVAMPSFESHYNVIIHIFSTSIWVLLTAVYFLTIFVYYTILKLTLTNLQKQTIQDLLLHVYMIFVTGASTLKTNRSSQKLLIGGVLLSVMVLSNTFQGSLTNVLSRPRRNPFIDTIDQVTKSDLSLQSQHAETFVTDPDILRLLKALRQTKLRTTNFIRLARFPIMHFDKYYTYTSYWPSKNLTENLHTVQECIKSNYLSFVVPQKSPLLNRINAHVLRFQESGLVVKWFGANLFLRKIFWPLDNEATVKSPPKVFAVKDLTSIFYLLLYGLTVATAIFLIENVAGRCKFFKIPCRK